MHRHIKNTSRNPNNIAQHKYFQTVKNVGGIMANDRPTSLRMGFGYHEARSSGVTKFDAPPSPSDMNFHLRWRVKEKELRKLIQDNPPLGPVVREIIAAQSVAGWWSVDWIFQELRFRKLIP